MKKLLIISILLLTNSLSAQTIRFVVDNPREKIAINDKYAYNSVFTNLELSYVTFDKENQTFQVKNKAIQASKDAWRSFFVLSETTDIIAISNIKLSGSHQNNSRWTWPSETPENIRLSNTQNSKEIHIGIAWKDNPQAEYIREIRIK